jgi:Ca-activated chloride channel family protein
MGFLRRRGFAAFLTAAAIALWMATPWARMFEATTRTVYVTITDSTGAPVPDLTAANFKVKEGGKDREIVKAVPATTPPHLALMVEERLARDTSTRVGLFEFVKRMNGSAEISLITVGLRNNTLVPFVKDPNPVLKAINELSLNPQPTSNLTEGINDMARDFDKENPPRPVMVVVAFSGGQAGGANANSILTQLRQSGATLYAVTYSMPNTNNSPNLGTMSDESGREQVLGDGAKQTGGRRIDVVTTAAVQKALQQVADDLAAQYMITYSLPDGVKPDKRINISIDRKGLSLRAPNAIADK